MGSSLPDLEACRSLDLATLVLENKKNLVSFLCNMHSFISKKAKLQMVLFDKQPSFREKNLLFSHLGKYRLQV